MRQVYTRFRESGLWENALLDFFEAGALDLFRYLKFDAKFSIASSSIGRDASRSRSTRPLG
jgi:hypothetical protein